MKSYNLLPIYRTGCYNIDVLTKIIAMGIIYTMSFLGYSPKDYSNFLPAQIRPDVIQNISPSRNNQTSTPEKVLTNLQIQPEQKTETQKINTTSSVAVQKTLSTKTTSSIQTSTTTQIKNPISTSLAPTNKIVASSTKNASTSKTQTTTTSATK